MSQLLRQIVEQSGVDIKQLTGLLVKNAAAELVTFYQYTLLRVNMVGLEAAAIKDIAETARDEDRNHFEALVPRIYELNGKLPDTFKALYELSACPPAPLPQDQTDTKALVRALVESERCAVREYKSVCDLTFGKDHRTYDLVKAILHEEMEHEAWFSEFLGQGPSGGITRRGIVSPHVRAFLP